MDLRSVATTQTGFERIEEMLDSGQTPHVKFGIDPTAPDLHLGHLVPLMAVKKLIEMGCKATIVLGDLTAQIGDPTGRDSQRNLMTHRETSENADRLKKQVSTILGEGNWFFVNNSSFAPSIEDMFAMLNTTTVSDMLGRSHFSKRMQEGGGITLLEMVCPLLQGWDSVQLECDLEVGGHDQLANCLQGRRMMTKMNQTPQAIMLFPLLLGTDGQKMSKSLGNHVAMTHRPEDVFGKTMSLKDELIQHWCNLVFHQEPLSDDPLESKEALAFRITKLFHGQEAAERAAEWFDHTFRKKLVNPEHIAFVDQGCTIIEALKAANLASSNGEARRLVSGGGVKIDSVKVSDDTMTIDENCTLQKGKRTAVRLLIR
jgi:tyrosyl-tRNA synthetase